MDHYEQTDEAKDEVRRLKKALSKVKPIVKDKRTKLLLRVPEFRNYFSYVEEWLEVCDEIIQTPARKKPQKEAAARRAAVAQAALLIDVYPKDGIDIKTKASRFRKLAEVLYGEEKKENLSSICATFLRNHRTNPAKT